MRIVYIAHIRLPTERAHGYAIMKMCEEFARLGNKVELIVPNKVAPALKEIDPFKYYGIERNFTLTRISSTDRLGIDDDRGRFSYWLDMFTFRVALFMQCRESLSKADICYTRDYQIAGFLPSYKTVLELHTLPAVKGYFEEVLKRIRRIVVISGNIKKDLELSFDLEILIASDAVDLERFSDLPEKVEARKRLSLPTDMPIALYAGHFYTWKGAEVFAKAARFVPEIRCVLVGGVDEDYKSLKKEYDRIANIIILPFQKPDLIPLYLASADVLVLPNRSTSEISARYTSPLKLFEYMATKRPIIASDLPSLREILDESMAFFVSPDDPELLANEIRKIFLDRVSATSIAKSAYRKVQQYSWKNRATQIVAWIRATDVGRYE